MVIGFVVAYGIVCIACIEDLRTKEVHTFLCIGFLVTNVILSFFMGRSFYQILGGTIPGIWLLLWNLILPEKIGGADIYFVLGSGFLFGFGNTFLLLLGSLLLVSLYGLVFMIHRKGIEEHSIAMIPALSLFYICLSCNMLREI